jgi:hypothetical protein
MYEHNSKNSIENYANNHLPQGNSCWPVIDLSHLEAKSLERRCTDPENYNMTKLRDLNNLANRIK